MPETDVTLLMRPIDPGLYRRGRGFAVLDMVFLPIEPAPSAPLSLPQPATVGYTSYVITDVETAPFVDVFVVAGTAATTAAAYGLTIQG